MVRQPKITSLDELQHRKKELRMDLELTKRELAHSMGTSREHLGSFLVKRVAAPVGGAGVALFALSKILSGGGRDREIVRETRVVHQYPDGRPAPPGDRPSPRRRKRAVTLSTLLGVGKLIVPIVQAIIGTVTAHRAEEHAKTAKRAAVRK